MRGALPNKVLQENAVVREYSNAKRVGAMGLAIGIRNANPDLIDRFNEVDDNISIAAAAEIEANLN